MMDPATLTHTARAALGLTRAGLADLLSVTPALVGVWETSQDVPPPHIIAKLKTILESNSQKRNNPPVKPKAAITESGPRSESSRKPDPYHLHDQRPETLKPHLHDQRPETSKPHLHDRRAENLEEALPAPTSKEFEPLEDADDKVDYKLWKEYRLGFRIEKAVTLPGERKKPTNWPFKYMAVGESCVIDRPKQIDPAIAACHAFGHRRGWKYRTEIIKARVSETSRQVRIGVRIWRVK